MLNNRWTINFFARELQRRDCIVLLSQGKVGSTTLKNTIEKVISRREQIYFTYEGLSSRIHRRAVYIFIKPLGIMATPRAALLALVRQHCLDGLTSSPKKIKVLIPVRDPFSHLVSSFFQRFQFFMHYLPSLRNASNYFDTNTLRLALSEYLLGDYPIRQERLSKNWLEKQVCPFFGLNPDELFNHPDVLTGKFCLSSGNAELLIFRYDLSDAEKEPLIAHFIDRPEFKIVSPRNVGAEKSKTGEIYQFCKQHVRFSRRFYEQVCQSRFYHSFYTATERERMEQHWIDPVL